MNQLVFLAIGAICWLNTAIAQTSFGQPGPYLVGESTVAFNNAQLQNPNVNAKAWFPSPTSGNSSQVAAGNFPVLAFGHGFNLNYLDYTQICSHLASWGFIVVSPDVQNGFNVDHQEFARELAACIQFIQGAGQDSLSMWYQHADTMSGVLGHSMGGGAAALLPSVFPEIDAVSGLASAETNPSAIAALANYAGPYQVISGSEDNVADESSNQIPMYNATLGSKHRVSITGGAHCKFTDGNTICDFVSGAGSISRQAQINISKRYLAAFFAYHLQGNADADKFLCGDSIIVDQNAGKLQFETNLACLVHRFEPMDKGVCFLASPNPSHSFVRIEGQGPFSISDSFGRQILKAEAPITIELPHTGLFFLHSLGGECSVKMIKQ